MEPAGLARGFLSRPAFVVDPNGAVLPDRNGGGLMAFGLDADGNLWTRHQPTAGGPFEPWTNIGATPILDDTLTVVPTPGRVRLLGLSGDGMYYTADYDGDGLGTWSALGDDQFEGAPSAVLMPDDTLQVFGVRDGDLLYKRETTSGFDGSWQSLFLADALTESAVGSASAIMAPNGGLVVGVRTDEDHVFYSGQVTPGSTQWTDWEEITDYTVSTESNPRLLAVPDENTWVVAYRDLNGTPLLFRHVSAGVFSQIPLVLPRR